MCRLCFQNLEKNEWIIIMRSVDIPLPHITNIIAICIVVHNTCAIRNGKFDMEWVKN